MPQFRNISGVSLAVYRPEGDEESLTVAAGQVINVPGDLATESPEDAFLVGAGDDARMWPKAHWELVQDQQKPKVAVLDGPAVKE